MRSLRQQQPVVGSAHDLSTCPEEGSNGTTAQQIRRSAPLPTPLGSGSAGAAAMEHAGCLEALVGVGDAVVITRWDAQRLGACA
jgi:hypothetical protein